MNEMVISKKSNKEKSKKKILLLDIENIRKDEHQLLELLIDYHKIYIVYAKSPISLSLDGLNQLAKAIVKGRLILIKMPRIGSNAADFGLNFLAGQLSVRCKTKKCNIDIYSNDKSLSYTVESLQNVGFIANQLKDTQSKDVQHKEIHMKDSCLLPEQSILIPIEKKESTELIQVEIKTKHPIPQNYAEQLKITCTHLLNHQHRPKKEDTLKNHIKSRFNYVEQDVEQLFNAMIKCKIIKNANGNKIEYCEEHLKLWAEGK